MRIFHRCVALLALAALAASGPARAQSSAPKAAPAAAQGAAQAAPAGRLALVIGNGAYREAPLPNPTNDAADMAKALEASGFTVMRLENATLREMHLALREFGDRLGRTSTGLFYFAGHGLQVRGRNYLLPVDADIAREDEVAFAALDLAAVLEKLDSARNPVNFVVLDACRNNPFGKRFQPAAKGLAQVDAPPGTLIAFATAPGSVSSDGAGRNGLYTHHLLREMRKAGAPVEEVFKSVRGAVRKESSGQQVPWESTSLETAFSFMNAPPEKVKVASAKPASGKGSSSSPASAPAPRSTGAPPEFAVGDTWRYRVTDLQSGATRRLTVKVSEVRAGEVRFSGGAISDRTGNWIRSIAANGTASDYHPPSIWYVFPMVPGASLTSEYVQSAGDRKFDTKVTLKVTGEEDLDTAAGRIRAVRVERHAQWRQLGSSRSGTHHATLWYSGMVKRYVVSEVTNTTSEGKVLLKERTELESYEVR
jgi:hypothetical protein